MVQISHETPEEIKTRLLDVIAQADFTVYEGTYFFDEFAPQDFATEVRQDALALVRDNEVWSQLIPSNDDSQESFLVFSFHFDGCPDSSGFVGWLASHLKQHLGTGVFVTCGQNAMRGSIFDYWGCPAELGEAVIQEIRQMRKRAE